MVRSEVTDVGLAVDRMVLVKMEELVDKYETASLLQQSHVLLFGAWCPVVTEDIDLLT